MIAIETMGTNVFRGAGGSFDPTPLMAHHFRLGEIREAYRVFSNRLDGVLKVAIRP